MVLKIAFTHDLLKVIWWVKHGDVLQNTKYIPTGSSPKTQKARSHWATQLPCVLGDLVTDRTIATTLVYSVLTGLS